MALIAPSPQKIFEESTIFRGPVSEAVLQSIGAAVNYALDCIQPVGSVIYNMEDNETDFQNRISPQASQTWIIADGRAVPGTSYATLIGASVPDLRGVFIRGKNYGRGTAFGNSAGDLANGTYQTDDYKAHAHTGTATATGSAHTHTYLYQSTNAIGTPQGANNIDNGSALALWDQARATQTGDGAHSHGLTIDPIGGNETQPRSVTLTAYIRIN